MNKKYKIRQASNGAWHVFGHTGGGYYIRLTGDLSSHEVAIRMVDYRERQSLPPTPGVHTVTELFHPEIP